jgi:hypothetical protein
MRLGRTCLASAVLLCATAGRISAEPSIDLASLVQETQEISNAQHFTGRKLTDEPPKEAR